jgi:hypothetical protein
VFESFPQLLIQTILLIAGMQVSTSILAVSYCATIVSIFRSFRSLRNDAKALGVDWKRYIRFIATQGTSAEAVTDPVLSLPRIDSLRRNATTQATFADLPSMDTLAVLLEELSYSDSCVDIEFMDCTDVLHRQGGIRKICAYFGSGRLSHVRSLSLIRCGLNDDDIARLAQHLSWHGHIVKLVLDGNENLSDMSVACIAESLIASNTELTMLSLVDCWKLSQEGVSSLAQACAHSSFFCEVLLDETVWSQQEQVLDDEDYELDTQAEATAGPGPGADLDRAKSVRRSGNSRPGSRPGSKPGSRETSVSGRSRTTHGFGDSTDSPFRKLELQLQLSSLLALVTHAKSFDAVMPKKKKILKKKSAESRTMMMDLDQVMAPQHSIGVVAEQELATVESVDTAQVTLEDDHDDENNVMQVTVTVEESNSESDHFQIEAPAAAAAAAAAPADDDDDGDDSEEQDSGQDIVEPID